MTMVIVGPPGMLGIGGIVGIVRIVQKVSSSLSQRIARYLGLCSALPCRFFGGKFWGSSVNT
jgi:hypothetical protein